MRTLMILSVVAAAVVDQPSQEPPRWHYMAMTADVQGWESDRDKKRVRLDSLGSEGWELVAAAPQVMGGYTTNVVLFLKRPR